MMIIGFIVLLGVSFFFPLALKSLVFLVAIYLFALFVGSIVGAIEIGDLRALFLIPFVVMLQHLAYGLGFLTGLIRWKVHD